MHLDGHVSLNAIKAFVVSDGSWIGIVIPVLLGLIILLIMTGLTIVQPNEAKTLTFLANMWSIRTAVFGLRFLLQSGKEFPAGTQL